MDIVKNVSFGDALIITILFSVIDPAFAVAFSLYVSVSFLTLMKRPNQMTTKKSSRSANLFFLFFVHAWCTQYFKGL